MIDPNNIIKFNRTDYELQEFWIFCVCVAGKNAQRTAKAVDNLLQPKFEMPFKIIRDLCERDMMIDKLNSIGIGQYNRISKCLEESLTLNLRTATISDLENIHGVGPKTSRFFLLYNRKNVRCAVLDTHILKFLNAGIKNTPTGRKYMELEEKFLSLYDNEKKVHPELTLQEYDLEIWKRYAN